MRRIPVAGTAIFLLSACGAANNNVWVKPGASQTEFSQVRYACMQQSQHRVSTAYLDKYGGASNSQVTTNDPLFSACMNAQGWNLQDKRQQQAMTQATKDGWEALKEEGRQLCSREDFQPHFNKSPCQAEDATLEQVADKSRITPSEKEALSKHKTESARIAKRTNEYVRQNDFRRGNSLVAIREQVSAESDKVTMDFYEGRISRGEYNKRRREIAERANEQWRVAQAS
jgi:hypothetical protein